MKKILSKITIAGLAVALLGGCSNLNDRLDNIEKSLNDFEDEKIASVENQVDGIKASIADLGKIRDGIKALQLADTVGAKEIAALKTADQSIAVCIDSLEIYVAGFLEPYASNDWLETTFATLDQYEATCDTLAAIDAKVGDLDRKISKAIASCADSLKKWVNARLGAYYTAAEIDAKIKVMKTKIDSVGIEGETVAKKVDALADEINVDNVKAGIKSASREAAGNAISSFEGRINSQLQSALAEKSASVAEMLTKVTQMETAVTEITKYLGEMEDMIQTVSIIPAYSNGSVKVKEDNLWLNCVISPKAAVKRLKKENFTVLVSTVPATKATIAEIKITDDAWFKANPDEGTVELRVPVKEYLPESDETTLTVALSVNTGISDITTGLVPVTILPPDYLPGEFSVSATRKVHFSKGNLVATIDAFGAPTAWKFAASQYGYIGSNVANTSIGNTAGDVDLFGWSTSTDGGTLTTDNYGIKTSTTNGDYSGDFYDWGKAVGDNGSYWSSSADGPDDAYYVDFNSSNVYPDSDDYRFLGFSVRLVTEVK